MENEGVLEVLCFAQIRMYYFVKHLLLQFGGFGGIMKLQRGIPDEGTPQKLLGKVSYRKDFRRKGFLNLTKERITNDVRY